MKQTLRIPPTIVCLLLSLARTLDNLGRCCYDIDQFKK